MRTRAALRRLADMSHPGRGSQIQPWWDDGTGRSEAEIALREGAALVGAGLLGILHLVDAVVEAWPLPGSRVRR
jgi:hypothetical protein